MERIPSYGQNCLLNNVLLLFVSDIQIIFNALFCCEQGSKNPSDLQTPKASDICTIMYTSGTSGDPKGVILTHENTTTNIRGVDLFMEQFEDKVCVVVLEH